MSYTIGSLHWCLHKWGGIWPDTFKKLLSDGFWFKNGPCPSHARIKLSSFTPLGASQAKSWSCRGFSTWQLQAPGAHDPCTHREREGVHELEFFGIHIIHGYVYVQEQLHVSTQWHMRLPIYMVFIHWHIDHTTCSLSVNIERNHQNHPAIGYSEFYDIQWYSWS